MPTLSENWMASRMTTWSISSRRFSRAFLCPGSSSVAHPTARGDRQRKPAPTTRKNTSTIATGRSFKRVYVANASVVSRIDTIYRTIAIKLTDTQNDKISLNSPLLLPIFNNSSSIAIQSNITIIKVRINDSNIQ